MYTDLFKAFNEVNREILCNKLETYRIHGDLLCWIKSYFAN